MYEYKKERINGFCEYLIDTNGVVYNKDGSIKKYSVNRSGYRIVTLRLNKKNYSFQIHRLVAIQFIPNPNNLPVVNHIDGDKQNNCISNLEWCTYSENTRHAIDVLHINVTAKVSCKKIIGINKNTGKIEFRFDSLADAGKYFANGKNYRYYQSSVFRALSGIRKTYKGCYWEYVNNT